MKKLIALFIMISLIKALASQAWAISPEHAQAYMPFVQALLKQDMSALAKFEADMQIKAANNPFNKMGAVDVKGGVATLYAWDDLESAPEGSVGLVNFLWPIQKHDGFCSLGTKSRIQQMQRLDAAKNISAVVKVSDTPGGTVDGTKECADYIKNEFSKPVVNFIDGLSASAGMWLSSAADERYASSETAEIGSIGTMITLIDWRKYDEAVGMKEHIIYATKSTRKNQMYHEALDGKYDAVIKNMLDPLNEIFINSVKQNIPGVAEEVFTGEIYLAAKAQELGLINGISTFEKAVQRAAELGNKSQTIKVNLKS